MTIIQKIVKAGELPPDWAKAFPDPNTEVQVVIRELDRELEQTTSLKELMDLISARVEKRGLTPELLQEILDERR